MTDLYRMLPSEGIKILLVLFLAFLLGLEREEPAIGEDDDGIHEREARHR